ncbi:uncharacterized protein LOC143216484 [Lasioglossum baleicum]|uniref:uncharacterized protein LOC143216484 n=1 Tax=Lasioglossum baleicum TaxID=434251 RepID=UPI003FCD0E9E
MSDFDADDSLTKLNTQLNRSMVLMDTTTDNETYPPKVNRSIKINTKIQPASPANASPMRRKSILKKSDTRNDERRDETEVQNTENEREMLNHTNNSRVSINAQTASRPHNINDLAREENLVVESTDVTFNLDNISDSEDVWIMDIPKTVDYPDISRTMLRMEILLHSR